MCDSEYCIGNISDFKYYSMNHIYYDYMLYNPLENKKCTFVSRESEKPIKKKMGRSDEILVERKQR